MHCGIERPFPIKDHLPNSGPLKMATCKDSSASQDEYSLRCSVCLDDFKDPKVLPCCHTFCKSCLKKLSSPPEQPKGHVLSTTTIEQEENELKSEEITLICPQCRSQHKVEGGVDSLLTDFAIESELRRLKKADHSLSEQNDVKLRCGLCESTDPVVSYCADCCSPLCNFCLRAHHRQRLYNGHCIKSIDEVDSKLLRDDTSIPHIQHAGRLVCCKHLNQIPQIFCNSCNELVCCECVIEGHDSHKFVGIDCKTRHEMEKKLTDLSSKISNVRQSFEEKLQYVTSVEKVTTEAEMQAKADIKKMFDSFITTLQGRRDSLLVKAENHYSAKLKLLWSEKDYLEKLIAKLNTTLRFSERSQKCANDGEYLSLASQALLRLKELEDSSWSSKIVEEVNSRQLHLEKKATEPKVFQTAARFDELKISLLTIEWKEFPVQVKLGAKHKAILHVKRNSKSFVLCEEPSIIIHHRNSSTCDVADIRISRSTDLPSAWDVSFAPYCGGPHTCIVSVTRANKLRNSFDVIGVPPVGSRVMRGPGWNYDETVHSYGANTTDVAIIAHHNALQTEKEVTVRWSDENLFRYKWDRDGIFDIQIYH
jgi:uncharacterized protein YbaR (Trm112 family)